MLSKLRSFRPSHTTVVAYLSLFVALGGSSYAAVKVTGKNVKDSSLTGKDVRNSSLTALDVKDRSLLARDFKLGQLPAGAQGAAGARGAPGVNGTNGATDVTIRSATSATQSSTESTVVADCNPGEVATGGGVQAQTSVGAVGVVSYSLPTATGSDPDVPTSWSGAVRNIGDPGATVRAITTVVCASP